MESRDFPNVVDESQADVFRIDEAFPRADEKARYQQFLRGRAVHTAMAFEDAHALSQDDGTRVFIPQTLPQGNGVNPFAIHRLVRQQEPAVGHPGLPGFDRVQFIRRVEGLADVQEAVVGRNQEAIDIAALGQAFDQSEDFVNRLICRLKDGVLRFRSFACRINPIMVDVNNFLPSRKPFQFRYFHGNKFIIKNGCRTRIPLLQQFFPLRRRCTGLAVEQNLGRIIPGQFQRIVRQQLGHPQ